MSPHRVVITETFLDNYQFDKFKQSDIIFGSICNKNAYGVSGFWGTFPDKDIIQIMGAVRSFLNIRRNTMSLKLSLNKTDGSGSPMVNSLCENFHIDFCFSKFIISGSCISFCVIHCVHNTFLPKFCHPHIFMATWNLFKNDIHFTD